MTQRAPAGGYPGFSQAAGDAQQCFEALGPIPPGEGGAGPVADAGCAGAGDAALAAKTVKRGATVMQSFPSNHAGAELQEGTERAEYP
jgi:hypothetical protein